MSGVLKGTASGTDRAQVTEQAEHLASLYFGTECLSVRLRDEQASAVVERIQGVREIVTFEVPFEAQVHHVVEARSYGPGVCRGCGASSWPQNPLECANWGTEESR